MNILKKFFDRLKGEKPSGTIESPVKVDDVKVSPRINHLVKCYVDCTHNAIYRLNIIGELLSAPKVEYVEGFHTIATMEPIKGLGVITIVFNSETGEAICAELKEAK